MNNNSNSIMTKVKDVSLVTKKSKAGNDYQMLAITFNNGYVFETYVEVKQP